MKIGNRPALYKRTVDILFDAYFNDTLEHHNCFACAVGNIIAGANGIGFYRDMEDDFLLWEGMKVNDVECTPTFNVVGGYNPHRDNTLSPAKMILIKNAGYTLMELGEIEQAFEECEDSFTKEDYMFNGLVAVLEVLKEIHGVEEDEESQQRFKAHYKSVLAR